MFLRFQHFSSYDLNGYRLMPPTPFQDSLVVCCSVCLGWLAGWLVGWLVLGGSDWLWLAIVGAGQFWLANLLFYEVFVRIDGSGDSELGVVHNI